MRRKPVSRKRYVTNEFDVDLTLLHNRQLFIYEEITEETAERINKSLYAIDTLNNNPIMLYINSPGGSCEAGLSIINTMKMVDSPIVTIIDGEACSMAGLIAIAGDKRVAYENSVFMAHAGYVYKEGKFQDVTDHAKFLEKYDAMLDNHLKKYTKLSKDDVLKAKNGELWLFADGMLSRGVVDEILIHSKK